MKGESEWVLFTDTQHKIRETLRDIELILLINFHGLLKYLVKINGNYSGFMFLLAHLLLKNIL